MSTCNNNLVKAFSCIDSQTETDQLIEREREWGEGEREREREIERERERVGGERERGGVCGIEKVYWVKIPPPRVYFSHLTFAFD